MAQQSKTFYSGGINFIEIQREIDQEICNFLADGKQVIHLSASLGYTGASTAYIVTIVYDYPAREAIEFKPRVETLRMDGANANQRRADEIAAAISRRSHSSRPIREPATAANPANDLFMLRPVPVSDPSLEIPRKSASTILCAVCGIEPDCCNSQCPLYKDKKQKRRNTMATTQKSSESESMRQKFQALDERIRAIEDILISVFNATSLVSMHAIIQRDSAGKLVIVKIPEGYRESV